MSVLTAQKFCVCIARPSKFYIGLDGSMFSIWRYPIFITFLYGWIDTYSNLKLTYRLHWQLDCSKFVELTVQPTETAGEVCTVCVHSDYSKFVEMTVQPIETAGEVCAVCAHSCECSECVKCVHSALCHA